jgi:predicted  nucleic acid-binding Zn-ribbon protein
MNFPEMIVALSGTVFVFGIPIMIIWTTHKRKMLELQLRLQNNGDNSVRAELNALREEMRALRDTTMQYDLSFDTAIQRMEQRMNAIERQKNTQESATPQEIQLGR